MVCLCAAARSGHGGNELQGETSAGVASSVGEQGEKKTPSVPRLALGEGGGTPGTPLFAMSPVNPKVVSEAPFDRGGMWPQDWHGESVMRGTCDGICCNCGRGVGRQ